MMLDTADNKIFFSRFYDIDTICSYDNSGQLKFDVDIEMEQGYWNTSTSRLWTRMRELMHDDIVATYNNMRQNGVSYENMMKYIYDEQIAKIPQSYYLKDYDVKYAPFADSYIGMANGDTYEHAKRWLTQRFRFCDSLFDYAPSYNNDVLTIRANTTELMTLEIETYTPVYQHLSWYNNQMDKKKIDGKVATEFSGKAMAATDQEVLIYGGSNVKSIKGIQSMNPNRMLIGSATRLTELDASNCPLLNDINANKANLSPHTYLNKLNLENCPLLDGNLRLNASPLIREINIKGTNISGLNLPSSLRSLEVMKLPKTLTGFTLNDATSLHTLDFEEGTVLNDVSMTNCNALTNVTNFDLSNAQQVTLNNSYNATNELYFKNASILSLSNMDNLEKVIYIPNAEHETFDITNLANTKDYNITTFNCPKLTTFMTTAPYRESYGKEYGEVKPNEVFEANTIDISNTQFTDVKLLCTTDTNVLKLPQTVKNLIVDSAYDLDTNYLIDGDYDTIHTELYEPYNTDYEEEVLLNGETPNLIPSASDGSIIQSMYAPTKTVQPSVGVWDLKGLELEEYHTFGLNNDVKLVDNTLTMPDRYDEYSLSIKNKTVKNEIARYTASDWNTFPTFNSGFTYTYDITKLDEVYEYSIMADSMDNLPTSISFNGKSNLLTVEYLNINNVTNMSFMFQYCKNLTSLDVSNWDTKNVTNIRYMFDGCKNLTSLDLSNWNTSKVTDMEAMFQNCQKLTTIGDISNWNTNKVTSMYSMFNNCHALTFVDVSNFDISKAIVFSMFSNCRNLTSLDVSNWDTRNVKSMNSIFRECRNLTSIGDVSNWNTTNVTTMKEMFFNCQNLTSLDLSNFDTSKVTNMGNMFDSCTNLTSLDVSNFNTSEVTDMSYMFNNCQLVTLLDVSNFNTNKVTNMYGMFSDCRKLTSLNASNWDTSKVTDMTYMFYGCWSLSQIVGLDKWYCPSLTKLGSMFQGCSKLSTLDLSNWKKGLEGEKVIEEVFSLANNEGTTYLDISGFRFIEDANFANAFQWSLTTLKWSNWDSSISISHLTQLSQEVVIDLVANLAEISDNETLTLGSTLLAKLTEEQIAVAVNKGWNIS